MKSSIFFAIIFGLLVPLVQVQGHIVWIQNKVVWNTITETSAVIVDNQGKWNYIDDNRAFSHEGYHLEIPDDIEAFSLVFIVDYRRFEYKMINVKNEGDQCWHYHGNKYEWEVYPCP
ncbi:2833_t:CDS:2 [Funneliformis geosporum]|uniref:6238_t:CDS:1 n=1 Tax=Funneliformis geosporum TaxID=1117311 RepID=A0A9W4SIJ7_9GLOM|nr:6238_t:CDS:2 [Funneliformis geosporum]CAI2170370.1 2833_t:CDS:2 [Funneliformis geosporum]